MSIQITALTAASDGLSSALAALPMQTFSGEFLEWAILFLLLAVVAAVLGARGVAGLSMEIAKLLIVLFVVLAIVTLVL